MNVKHILIIGYIQQKNKTEWEPVRKNLVLNCPIDANPYEYFPTLFKQLFNNWLVIFQEIKE